MAQFWAIATVLAAVPICATFPMDRLLFFVSFGSMALMAQFLAWVAERSVEKREGRRLRYRLAGAVAVVLVTVHLVLAPPLLALRSWSPRILLGDVLGGCERMAPKDPGLGDQDLVWVNGGDLCPGYVPIIRSVTGRPYPRRMRSLAGPHRPIELYRVDERTVVLKPVDGFLANPLERWLDVPFSLGHSVDLTGMRAEVLELTADGRPAAARFTFDVPLEDPSLRWVQWDRLKVEPVELPPVGGSIEIPVGWPF